MSRKDTFPNVAAAWQHKRLEPLAIGLMAAAAGLAWYAFHDLAGAMLMLALVAFSFMLGRRQTHGTATPDKQLVPTDPLNGPAQFGSAQFESGALGETNGLLMRDDVERLRIGIGRRLRVQGNSPRDGESGNCAAFKKPSFLS